jgi:nitrate reductase assembly molybdenum cofactor insertion protein NarJ
MSKFTFEEYEALCSAFAVALSYPQVSSADCAAALGRFNLPRKSRKALEEFHNAMVTMSVYEQQEFYTRTFDLSPLCSPALSVHLFGVESFKRSHLMVGLLDMYRVAEFDVQGETADHMPTVTRFLPYAADLDRREIIQYILIPALTKMSELLSSKQNPYAHLLEAVISAVSVIETTEVAYA